MTKLIILLFALVCVTVISAQGPRDAPNHHIGGPPAGVEHGPHNQHGPHHGPPHGFPHRPPHTPHPTSPAPNTTLAQEESETTTAGVETTTQ